jgi:hypothetical protein
MNRQVKHAFEKASEASEEASQEASRQVENAYLKAAEGSIAYQRKALAIAYENLDAAFGCAQELVGVKSPSEFIEVSMNHARQQFTAMAEQTSELASLAQKAATSSLEPLTNGVVNAFSRRI